MGMLQRRKLADASEYREPNPRATNKRRHHVLPWIGDPFKGVRPGSEKVLHQRHESDTIELFFDLFFVANLTTFTTYHPVLDVETLAAYIGFFAFIWGTWFQITLHDVRFSLDSVYERICKVIQMTVFVAFALVGSKFQPTSKKPSRNTNFRVLCYALGLSRLLLAIQYSVVWVFCSRKKLVKLLLPVGLCVLSFLITAGGFFAMTLAFRGEVSQQSRSVFALWWIIMLIEAIIIITISCNWRLLSFKSTHLVERMGLLTLIVIGEGAIGVTKTVSEINGHGITLENSALVTCIILLLFFLWQIYFDNQPKQHYGTIRQQIWSCLHFVLHLGIVGLVEGAQQIVLARYVLHNTDMFSQKVDDICGTKHLEGTELTQALTTALSYYEFGEKPETEKTGIVMAQLIYNMGITPGICSNESLIQQERTYGTTNATALVYEFTGAIFLANGAELPETSDPTNTAIHAFLTVYKYFWASFALILACTIIFLFLTRKKHKADLFDILAISSRSVCLIISFGLFAIAFKKAKGEDFVTDSVSNLISGPAIVPIVVSMLFAILSIDQLARIFCNWSLKRNGLVPLEEVEKAHHEAHHGHHTEKKHSVVVLGGESPISAYSPAHSRSPQRAASPPGSYHPQESNNNPPQQYSYPQQQTSYPPQR